MRDCDNETLRDQLPDLLHGRLPESARRSLQAHLDGCASCADDWRLLRSTRAALDARAPRVNVDAIAAAVAGRLAAERAPSLHLVPDNGAAPRSAARPARRPARFWSSTSLRAAAAVVIMAAGAGGVLIARRPSTPSVGEARPAASVAQAPVGVPSAVAVAESMPVAAPSAGRATAVAAAAAAAAAPASATSALGATFSDLSDEELAAVIRAVDSDAGLPAADSSAVRTLVTSGDVL